MKKRETIREKRDMMLIKNRLRKNNKMFNTWRSKIGNKDDQNQNDFYEKKNQKEQIESLYRITDKIQDQVNKGDTIGLEMTIVQYRKALGGLKSPSLETIIGYVIESKLNILFEKMLEENQGFSYKIRLEILWIFNILLYTDKREFVDEIASTALLDLFMYYLLKRDPQFMELVFLSFQNTIFDYPKYLSMFRENKILDIIYREISELKKNGQLSSQHLSNIFRLVTIYYINDEFSDQIDMIKERAIWLVFAIEIKAKQAHYDLGEDNKYLLFFISRCLMEQTEEELKKLSEFVYWDQFLLNVAEDLTKGNSYIVNNAIEVLVQVTSILDHTLIDVLEGKDIFAKLYQVIKTNTYDIYEVALRCISQIIYSSPYFAKEFITNFAIYEHILSEFKTFNYRKEGILESLVVFDALFEHNHLPKLNTYLMKNNFVIDDVIEKISKDERADIMKYILRVIQKIFLIGDVISTENDNMNNLFIEYIIENDRIRNKLLICNEVNDNEVYNLFNKIMDPYFED